MTVSLHCINAVLCQVLDSCQENLSSGAENFTKARISDVHALYQMDRSSRQMSGRQLTGQVGCSLVLDLSIADYNFPARESVKR